MKPAEAAIPARSVSTYAPDQPLGELGFAEQFVVWCLRVQWRIAENGAPPSLLVQRAFDALELPGGAELVADLAAALTRSIGRPLSIPCPHWRVLTNDEARILDLMAGLQGQTPMAPVRFGRGGHAAPCGASPVWAPAQRLALALSAAGLTLGNGLQPGAAFPQAMPRLLH
ncbi:MAG: hypothetical protein Q7V31_07935 [Parvibaculum sp.]|uniref:hypothetical protein n=1 Tax=Parvibaculum sp. TaxID=2024848 RepID=UPI00271DD5E5|nr:hypothetical protein [Parvibaculum sp.]MDO8838848.1 hypothetical protein [Parvibaculum sp.]